MVTLSDIRQKRGAILRIARLCNAEHIRNIIRCGLVRIKKNAGAAMASPALSIQICSGRISEPVFCKG